MHIYIYVYYIYDKIYTTLYIRQEMDPPLETIEKNCSLYIDIYQCHI